MKSLVPSSTTLMLRARLVLLAILSVIVLIAQIGLPWLSVRCTSKVVQQEEAEPTSEEFWNARFQFLSLRQPGMLPQPSLDVRSMTVCEDDVVVLAEESRNRSSDTQLIRFHLKSGQVTSSTVDSEIHHVVSDGHRLWMLPHHPKVVKPFIWDGRPRALCWEKGDYSIYRIIEFADGGWQELDRYVSLPTRIQGPEVTRRCQSASDNLVEVQIDDGDRLIYRIGVRTMSYADAVTDQEAMARLEADSELTKDQLRELGYYCTDAPPEGLLAESRWFENQVPCGVVIDNDNDGVPMFQLHGVPVFQWHSYESGKPVQSRNIRIPVHWSSGSPALKSFDSAVASNGRVFILTLDDVSDNRLLLLMWKDGQLSVAAQRGDPYFGRACLDAAIFFGLTSILPGILLLLLAVLFQRFAPYGLEYGKTQTTLASVFRRGVARSIDVTLVGIPLLLSVVLHPDAIGWWNGVIWELDAPFVAIGHFLKAPDVNSLQIAQESVAEQLMVVGRPPIIGWMFCIAVTIWIVQSSWRFRTGQSLGKWLMKIRTVGSTLGRAGWTRILLRELLLVVDSVFLVSWMPGVIAILATSRRQRIGDWLADTIVMQVRKGQESGDRGQESET